jgi:hypothetical protein
MIITFNKGEVTNHPNHKSLLLTAALFNFVKIYALRMRKRVSLLTAREAVTRALIIRGQQNVKGV